MKSLLSIIAASLLVSCQLGRATSNDINIVTIESGNSYRIYFNLKDVNLSEPLTVEAVKKFAKEQFEKRGYCPAGILIRESWIGRFERSNDRVIRVDCEETRE